ncbi:adenylylsulfate kinase [Desulfocucumis palustris]|uniref:Adenylyl-sulfate kinase n=1 Tax=Desulfocucumis palustris TaxID=1898651 RepID=A0A2L2XC58_9FIRM|nr:adenylyl-sulfate kinase [Desulfocucumis palustris]GBF33917.1 adenylylsulfate kinase [Desulfocucumis palustris]
MVKNEIANILWHVSTLNKEQRRKLKKHKSCILWITGLSASGKSTLANALECRLNEMEVHTYILDGDNIRHGLNKDLGFNPEDRRENIRRIAEVAKLFVDANILVITAFISPYREDRKAARQLVERGEFIEIYTKCPLNVCEKRDPKGLYKKARIGKIYGFTGITAPYEEPENPEIIIETDKDSTEESVNKIIRYLLRKEIIEIRSI